FVLALGAVAVAAPWLAPHDPTRQALRGRLTAPTLEAADGRARLLGTDHLGRDVLSRVIYGARVSLAVGVSAVVVGGALGAALGPARDRPPHPPQRALVAGRRRHARARAGDRARGDALLPRPRHPAAHAVVGRDDPRGARIPG